MGATNESNKANRLRVRLKAKQRVSAADLQWLTDYEKRRSNNGNGANSYGRSASKSRKVSFTEEETQAGAEGTGNAAEIAAAALMTRAEGERLDSILKLGINALVEANQAYKSMTEALLAERQADAETHRALLESLRTHFLEKTEAEAELIRAQAEAEIAAARDGDDDGIEKMAAELLLKKAIGEKEPELTPGNSGGGKKR